eukprot:251381-Rhodomonas_salina.4
MHLNADKHTACSAPKFNTSALTAGLASQETTQLTPGSAWQGLRKRIVRAFLQFIKDPQYNPEARTLMTEKFGTMTQTVGSTA